MKDDTTMTQNNSEGADKPEHTNDGGVADPRATNPTATTAAPMATPGNSTRKTFDLNRLRLPQNFDAQVGVKKVITHIAVRKPNDQEFFRVHPTHALTTQVLTLKTERETYLVDPDLWPVVPSGALKAVTLVLTVTRQKTPLVWPLRLPREDGRLDLWGESALAAAERGKTAWVRVSANMGSGMYELFEAAPGLSEPEWPALTFDEIIELAFRGQVIEAVDHPALRALRGEL